MATRKLGLTALMRALYDLLEADADVTAYAVYNHAPRTAAFPYITFGTPISTESRMLGSRDTEAESNVVTVHCWSDEAGDKQCSDMMTHVIDAVFNTSFTVAGYFAPVDIALDYAEIMIDLADPSRPVRHGILRIRVEMAPS